MSRLTKAAEREPSLGVEGGEPTDGGLSGTQSEKLCSYMTVLRHLIGKDLGGMGEVEMSDDELLAALGDLDAARTGKDTGGNRAVRKASRDI